MHVLVVLLLAAAIKDGGAPLRAGCEANANVVAQLLAGADITIRYSLSGEAGPCYKVTASVEGRTLDGYLPGSAIADTSAFDKARKQGGRVGSSEAGSQARDAEQIGRAHV